MLAQHEYTLEPDADQMLRRIFTGLHAGEDSGNARFARTLFEQALNRQALHAAILGFEHPVSGEILRFEAPLPVDMARLRQALSGARLVDRRQP
jgi:hypothetical protein